LASLDTLTEGQAERGFENFVHASGVWARASGGTEWFYPGLSCFASTVQRRAFNQVLVATPGTFSDPDLADALARFGADGLRLRVRVRDVADDQLRPRFEGAGLVSQGTLPAMVFDGELPPGRNTGLEVARVASKRELEAHTFVVAEAFEWDPAELGQVFRTPILHEPSWLGWVGYDSGEPVAASQLVAVDGTGGIYYVAVLGTHRRKGYGEAITRVAIEAAYERGCDLVTLNASQYGYPVYKRMGFRDAGRHAGYIPLDGVEE
jgi:ribosomal protein S18 acetylase RimI-like enzyme